MKHDRNSVPKIFFETMGDRVNDIYPLEIASVSAMDWVV